MDRSHNRIKLVLRVNVSLNSLRVPDEGVKEDKEALQGEGENSTLPHSVERERVYTQEKGQDTAYFGAAPTEWACVRYVYQTGFQSLINKILFLFCS